MADALTGDEGGLDALALTVERLRRELADAQESAEAGTLVGMATGILVARGHGGPAEAARHLRELAAAARLPLAEVAADIVDAAAGDATRRKPGGPGSGRTAEVRRLRAAEAGTLSGDTQTAAEALLRQALAPLGATALAVWQAHHDGSLTLAGQAGLSRAEAWRWRNVPPGVGTAAQRALADGQPRWYEELPPGLPGVGGREGRVAGARAVLPARVGGRSLGVLEVCWPESRPDPGPAELRRLDQLAGICALTLPGGAPSAGDGEHARAAAGLADGLLDPAMVLLPVTDQEGEVRDFRIVHVNERFEDFGGRSRAELTGMRLLEAYPLAARDGGLYSRVLRVHRTGEPLSAERMTLAALNGAVPQAVVATVAASRYGEVVLLSWRVEDNAARLSALLQHAQRLGRIGAFEENRVTGEITWSSQLFTLYGLGAGAPPVPLERLHRHAHPDDAVAVGRFLRTLLHRRSPASTGFRMPRPDGVVRHIRLVAEPVLDAAGDLVAVRGAYQDVSAQHWTEVALAATRDRLADSEQLSAERNLLALQLQQAIMPPAPAPVDAGGVRVAVRYRPAEQDYLVGGDWYDAVVLPSKQVLLTVGDVAGHGIAAATVMVTLRNALRGLAFTGAGPAQLLGWLNAVAHHLPEHATATAVCALYDPQTKVLRWARAGHPPPVLVHHGTAEVLPLPRGILLGAVAETSYEERELRLTGGDWLLMYTDGLVERRGMSVERSLAQLLAWEDAPPELDEQLDRLLTHSRSDTDDDTCLVGIEVL